MYRKHYLWILTVSIVISNSVHSAVLTNQCTGTPSCNCILTNDTNLDMVCDPSTPLSVLPVLNNPAIQVNVTYLRVSSSTTGTNGPLTTLPNNICSSYPKITVLDLSSNSITGFLNTSLLACFGSNLISVDFSKNRIDDIDLNLFQANNRIQTIILSYNNLVIMPKINSTYFTNFPSTIDLIDFSYNQITNVDLWPLFVKTGKNMIIDMSYNQIRNFTNQVPIYVKQFTETPDPRSFYLNNNQIERLSDLLLEQYGACATLSSTASSYFIVGISNLLLTNNSLICDCESYYLIKFINDHTDDFPELGAGSALINQAYCSAPLAMIGQQYIFSNFSAGNACSNFTLPNRTEIFCSVYTNQTSNTITPPTYWSSSTTVSPTISNSASTSSNPGSGGESSQNGANGLSNSTSPSWYIMLGIALGVVFILVLVGLTIFLLRDKILPAKCLSYCPMHGSDSDFCVKQPEQGIQTACPIQRPKPIPTVARKPQPLPSSGPVQSTDNPSQPLSTSTAIINDVSNIKKTIKGIPLASITGTSELDVTPIPLAASKRAKPLPQVISGSYLDTMNSSLLNTSASALISTQRQRRKSASWTRRPNPTKMTPPPAERPKSVVVRKTVFSHEDKPINENIPMNPTFENLSSKSSKPLRTLPLLNITVISAWIDNADDKK